MKRLEHHSNLLSRACQDSKAQQQALSYWQHTKFIGHWGPRLAMVASIILPVTAFLITATPLWVCVLTAISLLWIASGLTRNTRVADSVIRLLQQQGSAWDVQFLETQGFDLAAFRQSLRA